jgi:hypothetical protein
VEVAVLADTYKYSARDMTLEVTDTKTVPWYIVRSDDKKRARLNCISNLLSLVHHKTAPRGKVKVPKRSMRGAGHVEITAGKEMPLVIRMTAGVFAAVV